MFGSIIASLFNWTRTDDCSKVNNNVNNSISSIPFNSASGASNPDYTHTLKEYYIKTSYNSCRGTYDVNICNLTSVLRQGARCLDFQIFSINDNPVVATSYSSNNYTKDTLSYVNFSDVLATIKKAFTGSEYAPNPSDPIFINLRFNSNNQKMYSNLATMLKSYGNLLLDPTYSYDYQCSSPNLKHGCNNLGDVPLKNLVGKLIIIVDKSSRDFLENEEFMEYVNLTSNSLYMRSQTYSNIQNQSDLDEVINFNMTNMTFVIPDSISNTFAPDMRKVGCQMIAMHYHNHDANFEEDTKFYNSFSSAFVLKPAVLRINP